MDQNVRNATRNALGAASFRQVLIIVLLTVVTPFLHGQNLTSVTADARRPGDTIRVVLTFDAPVKLSGASFRFNLQKLTEPAQKLWPGWINSDNLKSLNNPNQWEISGSVPAFTASGEYRLDSINVNVDNLSKSYQVADLVHNPITLTVINDRKDPIPSLTDVTLVPAK